MSREVLRSLLTLLCISLFSQHVYSQCTGTGIGGRVYTDLNADAVQSSTEEGIAGITVLAYDKNGILADQGQTDSNGWFELTQVTSGSTYRIEFHDYPDYYESTQHGSENSTTVQFATSPSCNLRLAFADPSDYCQANPTTATACYVIGAYNGVNTAEVALAKLPYLATGKAMDKTSYLSSHGNVGTTYGIAYQRSTNRMYAAAYNKRYSGFGPGGPDAIYQTDTSGTVTGTIKLSLISGGASAGADAHSFALSGNELYPRDNASFDKVGKIGFGDIEISGDNKTLYVVNLFNRKLYAIDISSGNTSDATVTNSWVLPDPCGSSEHRPMGLGWNKGTLYIGTVCEDASNAYVHSLTPGNNGDFTLEATVPMGYTRELIAKSSLYNSNITEVAATWRAWTGSLTNFVYTYTHSNSNLYEIAYPQPMLSDIEFDGDDMILGIRDRFGDQVGYKAYHVPSGSGSNSKPSSRFYSGDAVGDILRVCKTGNSYTVETGTTGTCKATYGNTGPNSNSGPGGAEYYYWDTYHTSDGNYSSSNLMKPNSNRNYHFETTMGGLLQIEGSPFITTTAMDPFGAFTAGYMKFDNNTGQRYGVGTDDVANSQAEIDAGGYQIFSTLNAPQTFGKANGLGDIEAMCEMLPFEIGNYAWSDNNGNGIQDPGEPGIGGLNVGLYDESGNLLAITVTQSGGEYFFSHDGAAGQTWSSSITQLSPMKEYYIVYGSGGQFQNGSLNLGGNAYGISPTGNGVGGSPEINDSDAALGSTANGNPAWVNNQAFVTFTTGTSGGGSHTFDVGFEPTKGKIGDLVWYDINNNGIKDLVEIGLPGVTVTLYNGDGVQIADTVTNVVGKYRFTDVAPGTYSIGFELLPNYVFASQTTGTQSGSDANTETGKTNSFFLSPGESNDEIDAGMQQDPNFPVEWTGISAKLVGKDALLDWGTTKEINSDYFQIERSADGNAFSSQGTVKGAGNSDSPKKYQFTDLKVTDLNIPTLYYRIKQVDLDGKNELSNVVELRMGSTTAPIKVMAYPNPASETLTVRISATQEGEVNIRILDILGKEYYRDSINGQVGKQEVLIPVTTMAQGTYYVQVTSDTYTSIFKVVIQ